MNSAKSPADAFSLFQGFKPLHGIIHYYVDLSCFLVVGSQARDWWALNRRKRLSSLFALEVQYGNVLGRDQAMGEGFERATKTLATAEVERFGFYDLVVPVQRDGKLLGFLQAGAFAKDTPQLASLERVWRELTGLEPTPSLPQYREYIRTMLEIPVLDGELLPAFRESMELYAGVLGGGSGAAEAEARTRALLHQVISKGLPHSYFMDWALGRPTSESVPAWDLRMEGTPWIRDEIGLTRAPTTVLVAMPRTHGKGAAWAEERLQMAAYQRAAFRHAQSLPETVGGRLDDYGAVFVSSATPGKSRMAQKQELEDLAEKIRDFARKHLSGDVLVSIGPSVEPGASLKPSYLQAFMSLHGAKARGRESGAASLQQGLDELASSFEEQNSAEIRLRREAWLSSVLQHSFFDPGEMRLHFQYAVGRVASVLAKRLVLSSDDGRRLGERAATELGAASNAQELVAAFRDALERLQHEPTRAQAVTQRLRIEELLARLNERPGEAQPLARLAKEAGVSVSTFSREFKRVTGQGFEGYLQQRRLEMARRLLNASNLAVASIAKDCGFKSPSYFSRLFSDKCGLSPDAFRKKSRSPQLSA